MKECFEIPYTTKKIIRADFENLSNEEFENALNTLVDLGLIKIDKDGKIFELETTYRIFPINV